MKTTSYWLDTAALPQFPPLSGHLNVDAVVIGGGLTGISAAYLLKKAGCRVALLERGRCGGVDTSYTTAHLTRVTDTRLHTLVHNFGQERARAVWDAGLAAMDQISDNIFSESIACDFEWVPGYLHAAPGQGESERETLQKDAQLASELGCQAEFLEAIPYFNSPGVRFHHQARFHPLKYLAGLLRTIPGNGSFVFEQTEAAEFQSNPLIVKTPLGDIHCEYLVLATHSPLMGTAGLLASSLFQTKLYLYSSYALGAQLPTGHLPEALFWDTSKPYYYLRVDSRADSDYAIFGGEDHKTGQEPDTEAVYRRLERVLLRRIPEARIDHRWSGQVIETTDGLPFIGETAPRQFVATGFAGNGMTFGTLGAMMSVDAFLERKNPWSELFDPHRKKLRGAAWHYFKENTDYPYYLLRDWISGAEQKTLRALKRHHGMILDLGGKKVAAYRDAKGKVFLNSPVCTHLKCIVGWNSAEQTWDCPCHGSRFGPKGNVLSGPAEENLARIELASEEPVKKPDTTPAAPFIP